MRIARRSGRKRRRVKVTLSCGVSFTVDMSAGGFCTESMRVLPAGSTIDGTIEFHGKKVEFTGRVAWSTAGDATLNMRGRMGIEFVDASSEVLDLVMGKNGAW